MSAITLPDGITLQDLETLDLSRVTPDNAEKMGILADLGLKYFGRRRREGWVSLAKVLYWANEHQLWRHLPGGFTYRDEWLKQPEIDIDPATAANMIHIAEHHESLQNEGYDLFQLVLDVGPGKVRTLIPAMNKVVHGLTDEEKGPALAAQFGPILDQMRGADLSGVIEMLHPEGTRLVLDPEAVYQEFDDGTYAVTFTGLDYDTLELIAKKLKLRKWVNSTGQPIPSPIALPERI